MDSPNDWLVHPGGVAEQLLGLRKAAQLTGERLSQNLGWPRSKVSKLENGRQIPSDLDITEWVQACGASVDVERGLHAAVAAGRAQHRQWKHELRRSQTALQSDVDALVRNAASIQNFEIMVIPGLLQTASYARVRVLENVRVYGADPAETDAAVAARRRRQDVLYETGKRFEFLVTEAALIAGLCPPEVMVGQLDWLLSFSGMENVAFGIVPFGAAEPINPLNGFLTVDDITFVETFASEIEVHGEEAASYRRIFGLLWDAARIGDDARQMILAAQDALRA